MFNLIVELFWRACLFIWFLYALDIALDGKLDLPHKKVEWNELRIARWLKKLLKWLLSHVHKTKGGKTMNQKVRVHIKALNKKDVFRAWVSTLPVNPAAQKAIEKIYLEKGTKWGEKQ